MKGVREFEEQYEKLGPLMFGLHDGHSEAPKVSEYPSKRLSKVAS